MAVHAFVGRSPKFKIKQNHSLLVNVANARARATRCAKEMKIVLDQNCLSDRAKIEASDDTYVIPDITWFENVKSHGWRDDVRRSFEVFHDHPSRLEIAYPIGRLLGGELGSRKPFGCPIDQQASRQLQELLKKDNYISEIEANVETLRSKRLEPYLHLSDKRTTMQEGMDSLRKIVGEETMKAFRKCATANPKPRLVEFAPSIRAITDQILPHSLADLGVPDGDQAELLSPDSVIFRFQASFWAQVLQYSKDGKTLQKGDKKFLNDVVDSDYAIIASFFDGLDTGDDDLRERHEALATAITDEAHIE